MTDESKLGRVTQMSPLRVRIQGDTADAPAEGPIGLRVGAEVLVWTLSGRRFAFPARDVNRMIGYDTRDTDELPAAFTTGMSMSAPEFKNGNAIGLSGAYFAVVTITPWQDNSGGMVQQLAFGAHTYYHGIWRRIGSRGGAWGPWSPLAEDSGWVEFDATQFYGGWSKYESGLNGTYTPRWRRLNGIIYLEGLVNLGTFQTISCHNLPAACRPTGYTLRPTVRGGAASARLDVNTNAQILFPETPAGNTWYSVACSYPAAI